MHAPNKFHKRRRRSLLCSSIIHPPWFLKCFYRNPHLIFILVVILSAELSVLSTQVGTEEFAVNKPTSKRLRRNTTCENAHVSQSWNVSGRHHTTVIGFCMIVGTFSTCVTFRWFPKFHFDVTKEVCDHHFLQRTLRDKKVQQTEWMKGSPNLTLYLGCQSPL